MSNEHKESSGSPIIGIVVGIVLMLGGMYVYKHPEIIGVKGFQEAAAGQGIPLEIGKTIATIGVFFILFPVIKMFFLNPLAEAINNRTHELERTFAEAEQLRAEMTTMRGDYERRLAETEASAREQIQRQINEAQALRQSLEADAKSRADQLIAKATADIEAEKAKVIVELRTHVVDLALAAAEKVVGENMNDDRNRKLVDDFINKVEVPA